MCDGDLTCSCRAYGAPYPGPDKPLVIAPATSRGIEVTDRGDRTPNRAPPGNVLSLVSLELAGFW